MSGNKNVLLDTNALIFLFKGNTALIKLIENRKIYLSIISFIEYLSFPLLTNLEKKLIHDFIKSPRVELIEINLSDNNNLVDEIINIRLLKTVKLPDAIIVASAKSVNAVLITSDTKLINTFQSQINIVDYLA